MNDMRFNNQYSAPNQVPAPRARNFKLVWSLVFGLVIILASGLAYLKFGNMLRPAGASDYYAVFLDNNQTYFGKITSKSKDKMVLSGVYYLQANTDPNIERFNLIRLGQELHGPTSEMIINMNHVIFYEHLRDDSKLVQSIIDKQESI